MNKELCDKVNQIKDKLKQMDIKAVSITGAIGEQDIERLNERLARFELIKSEVMAKTNELLSSISKLYNLMNEVQISEVQMYFISKGEVDIGMDPSYANNVKEHIQECKDKLDTLYEEYDKEFDYHIRRLNGGQTVGCNNAYGYVRKVKQAVVDLENNYKLYKMHVRDLYCKREKK